MCSRRQVEERRREAGGEQAWQTSGVAMSPIACWCAGGGRHVRGSGGEGSVGSGFRQRYGRAAFGGGAQTPPVCVEKGGRVVEAEAE